jgi:hypothetical protein
MPATPGAAGAAAVSIKGKYQRPGPPLKAADDTPLHPGADWEVRSAVLRIR